MKKTYLKPNSEVIKIGTIQMVAASYGKDSSSAVDPSGPNVLGRDDDDEW